MFSRSSRGQLPRPSARSLQPLDQLHLPWLCPVLCEQPRARQNVRTSASSSERKGSPGTPYQLARKVAAAQRATPGRGFASPATQSDTLDDYIPFVTSDILQPSPQSFRSSYDGTSLGGEHQNMSELPPWDPTQTLRFADSVQTGSRKFTLQTVGSTEIEDIHAILQAYLHVGQFERAMSTVRRLHEIHTIDSPELFSAHLAYIATVVSHIIITRDQALLKHLKRWFNEDVRAKGVIPSGTMIALLVQAGLKEHNNNKVGRSVRDYLHAAKKNGVLYEAQDELKSCLSEEEYNKVLTVASEYFDAPATEAEVDTTDTPQARPQEQKGYGLIALKQSLSIFSDLAPGKQAISPLSEMPEMDQTPHARQLRLEEDTINSALERWRADHAYMVKRTGGHSGLQSKQLGALMWNWQNALTPLITEELERIQKSPKEALPVPDKSDIADRRVYGPFLQYLSVEKLSAVTIISCVQSLVRFERPGWSKGCPLTTVVSNLGKAVEEESVAEIVKARNRQWMSKKMPEKERKRQLSRLVLDERIKSKPDPLMKEDWHTSGEKEWSNTVRIMVGVSLLSMLLKSAKIDVPVERSGTREPVFESQLAFSQTKEYKKGHRVGGVRFNETLSFKLRKEPAGSTLAKQLPMLTPPTPWTGYREGGFLMQPVEVIRLGSKFRQLKQYGKLAANSGDLKQVFAGLDVLGRTPWKINKGVFDVMLDVWNSGEGIGEIPPANPEPSYPPEPKDKESVAARRLHAWQCRRVDNHIEGLHSNRCFQNFQIEVARAFRNETFYFPHNVDFRGRAYPIPPFLNHMGADNARGLLMFGKGRELGDTGLRWLRVHLANVFGYDKASFNERHQFAIDHMDDICDSATNPLKGRRWWLKAEDPWQCLATCIELSNANSSPDPTAYVSHLPIHQDGTCNGLQHYAALGGDATGAKQVNLEPGERPADIYTAVAEMVQEKISKDIEGGVEIAKILDGKIKRKIVKQTVMTNVYGVTFIGAMLQVRRQLEDIYPDLFKENPETIKEASFYIARKIFDSLSAMFTGAHDIQHWLTESAARICQSLTPEQVQLVEDRDNGKATSKPFRAKILNPLRRGDEITDFRSSVIWTTPLKMPVVQPYRKARPQVVKTNLQTLSIVEPSVADPVYKAKQVQAFPPNFIHSLDATHMLLSALKCDEVGLTFAAVHDSFWTHAADVDTMNQVLRDAFIKMHSEDIIGRLAAEFAVRYKGGMTLVKVPRYSVIGQKIFKLRTKTRASKETQNKTKIQELLREKTRLRLLTSEDATKQAEGAAIITPASLIASAAKEDLLYLDKDSSGVLFPSRNRSRRPSQKTKKAEESKKKAEMKSTSLDTIDDVTASDFSSTDFDSKAVPAAGLALELDTLKAEESAEIASADAALASSLGNQTGESVEESKWIASVEQNRRNSKLWAWVPLTFPEIPKKGTWDVARLKESKYFFS